jgi:hypothetical protein
VSRGSLGVREKAIRYPHRVELELNPNQLVLTMKERSGSIWMRDDVEQK